MRKMLSARFGEIEYARDWLIEFPAGLPGFEGELLFLPIEQPGTKPLVFLQSLARPEVCFITVPVNVIDPSYELNASPEDLATLLLPADERPAIGADVLCLAILQVGESCAPTANLLSPVVVNLRARRAVQVIQCESRYGVAEPLAAVTEEARCS